MHETIRWGSLGKHIVVAGPWMGCDAGLSVNVYVLYRTLVERLQRHSAAAAVASSLVPQSAKPGACATSSGASVAGVEAIPHGNVPSS